MQALKLILLFTLKALTWVNTNTLTWKLIGTVTWVNTNTLMWELIGTVTWVYTNTLTWELMGTDDRTGPDKTHFKWRGAALAPTMVCGVSTPKPSAQAPSSHHGR